MSPEAFNHTMPRGLLPRQLKVLGFLDHLSWSIFDPFYLFLWPWLPSSVKHLCVWKLRYWSNLSAVNLEDVLSASAVGCCGKWVLSRACGYWKRNSLHLACATDSFQIITLDFEIENVQIQSWFESPLHSDLCQIWLTLSLCKLSDGIR